MAPEVSIYSSWSLRMGQIACRAMSVTSCQRRPRNILEEWRPSLSYCPCMWGHFIFPQLIVPKMFGEESKLWISTKDSDCINKRLSRKQCKAFLCLFLSVTLDLVLSLSHTHTNTHTHTHTKPLKQILLLSSSKAYFFFGNFDILSFVSLETNDALS